LASIIGREIVKEGTDMGLKSNEMNIDDEIDEIDLRKGRGDQ